jgi:large subunit ribosomal protein L30
VRIAEALGLKKVRQTVVKPDTPVIRGMINKIGYLIEIKAKG